MDMNKNNVLLLEKQDESTIEVFEGEKQTSTNTTMTAKGIKIHKVIQPVKDGFEVIVQHIPTKEITDITKLRSKSGFYMVSVDKDEYGNFMWTCFTLGDFLKTDDDGYEMMTIKDPIRKCTPEECEFLDTLFPEYFDNAF